SSSFVGRETESDSKLRVLLTRDENLPTFLQNLTKSHYAVSPLLAQGKGSEGQSGLHLRHQIESLVKDILAKIFA
ncbi:hypothetical protein Q8G50_34445, partial [Klebsiella pneumoniae]